MKLFNNISAQQLGLYQLLDEKGIPNGYAPLGPDNLVPAIHLPFDSFMTYQGTWDASTNTPTLVDGVGSVGDVYYVSTGGTQDLGSGSTVYNVQDIAIYNGTTWQRVGGGTAIWGTVSGLLSDQVDLQAALDNKHSQGGDTFGVASVIGTNDVNRVDLVTSATTRITILENGLVSIAGVADPSAILTIGSNDKGLLIPRLTTLERDGILIPATGLLIYNTTTNQFEYFDGVVWIPIGSGLYTDNDAQLAVQAILNNSATIEFISTTLPNTITANVIDGSIDNNKLALMAPNTVKVNNTAVLAPPIDLNIPLNHALGRLEDNVEPIPLVEEWVAVPATSLSIGEPGQKSYDVNFVYFCVDLNTWVRVARDLSF